MSAKELEIKALKQTFKELKLVFPHMLWVVIITTTVFTFLSCYSDKAEYELENMYTSSNDTVEDREYVLKRVRKERNLWLSNLVVDNIGAIVSILFTNLLINLWVITGGIKLKTIAKFQAFVLIFSLVLVNWIYEYLKGEKFITKDKVKGVFFKFLEYDEKITTLKESVQRLKNKTN